MGSSPLRINGVTRRIQTYRSKHPEWVARAEKELREKRGEVSDSELVALLDKYAQEAVIAPADFIEPEPMPVRSRGPAAWQRAYQFGKTVVPAAMNQLKSSAS